MIRADIASLLDRLLANAPRSVVRHFDRTGTAELEEFSSLIPASETVLFFHYPTTWSGYFIATDRRILYWHPSGDMTNLPYSTMSKVNGIDRFAHTPRDASYLLVTARGDDHQFQFTKDGRGVSKIAQRVIAQAQMALE